MMARRDVSSMKSAGYIAIVGGTLLVIGGATGWGIFEVLLDLADKYVTGDMRDTVLLILKVLIFMAALGGILVIIGGYLMLRGNERIGKILAIIGTGFGLITIIIGLISALATGSWDAFIISLMTFTGIGTILSIIAQKLA
jgi:hypothetical protein